VAIDPDDLARSVKELERRSPFVPVTIADRLSWEEFSRVAVNAPALPGVTPEVGLSRFYPLEADFAHVVGYVGPVSDFDLSKITDPDPLLQIPKFQIGKINVESRLEDDLRGRAGTREIEVNAAGRIMRELGRVEGTPGTDLQLTIDAGLQNFSQARMAGESAAAVVMDTQTGDVLALASAPSFDPNLFVRGISVADYTKLTEDEYRPLANKTVQGIYPPGSTFKMITALAALEAGLVEIDEEIFCGGYKELGNRRFHCWRRGGHGKVDLVEAIYQSCDVYFYDIAERVGIEAISEVARKLGMNHRHELPLSGIAEGLAPTKDWKRARRGEDWLVGDTLNSGIGQGFVLASPLQLAVMTARLASGRAVEPRLLKSVNGVETPLNAGAPLPFKASNLAAIREGMDRVSNFQRGTAFRSRIVADGMAMAGKTGTSQVRNITAEERAAGVTQNADLPWNRRDHALFVAYAPVDNPRFACSVIVEHGGGGSTAAAPIARDIMLYAQFGAVPPLSAYPAGQHNEISDRFDALQLRRFERETTVRART
jgi:penicillin-binding protein 2